MFLCIVQRLWMWIRELLQVVSSFFPTSLQSIQYASARFSLLNFRGNSPVSIRIAFMGVFLIAALHNVVLYTVIVLFITVCVSLQALVSAFSVQNKHLDAKTLKDYYYILCKYEVLYTVFQSSAFYQNLLLLLVKFNSN